MAPHRGREDARFSLLETALITLFAGFCVWVATGRASSNPAPVWLTPETAPFIEAYGPTRNSQRAEEWLIRDFFADKRDGFFVDVGANHYQEFSNTYYLEAHLGWSGIAIEPLQQFEADYKRHRPRTLFAPFFVSDESDIEAKMFLVDGNHRVTSARRDFAKRFDDDPDEIEVSTVTLDDLLDGQGVTTFDFLSMDIELFEPYALAGFDVERFGPSLVCIEAHPEVRQQILNYFASHGYVVVARYLRADIHNLYFAPLSSQIEVGRG